MNRTNDPIRTGGLFRCCIQTIKERKEPGQEGDTINCAYACGGAMVFKHGAWEWKR